MEEKKNWVKEIGNIELEISYTSGVYDLAFLMGYGWYEEVEKIVEQIKQESREEGRREGYQNCMDDIWEKARGLRSWTEHDGSVSAGDIEAGLREAYLEIEEELDKLTTK